MKRRFFLQKTCLATACTAALALGGLEARGQDAAYPSQMVRIVVPFSAGSMTDVLARSISA